MSLSPKESKLQNLLIFPPKTPNEFVQPKEKTLDICVGPCMAMWKKQGVQEEQCGRESNKVKTCKPEAICPPFQGALHLKVTCSLSVQQSMPGLGMLLYDREIDFSRQIKGIVKENKTEGKRGSEKSL